ncbi:hypothetical protein GCM10009861_10340 [Neomicrococcus aestuarii]
MLPQSNRAVKSESTGSYTIRMPKDAMTGRFVTPSNRSEATGTIRILSAKGDARGKESTSVPKR